MYENDEIEIDLSRVFGIVKKHFKPFALIILATSIVAALVTLFLIPKKYTAEAKLIIVQKSNPDSQQISYNDLQTSQKLVNTYSEILKSEAISDDVIQNLKLDQDGIDHTSYLGMVSISSVKDTEVIKISVETKDPKLSANIANEIVSVFRRKIVTIMNIENVTVLNSAKVPEQKSSPSNLKNTLIGFLLGCVIDGCIVVYLLLNDRNIRTEEEMKQIFDYPIIGLIPDMNAGGTE
ncbi:YveK family protein [Holdemania massiliensis]|uniref:YveK family protein n=1 Tax=Holdemania massiliensis TaxID=1468449 RepID=UPI001F05899C|nr:Wzz/FepE/Etk N-terminal domain-containing protein [Holdemania massiliensis]MCH1940693.1 Wzz/FepE/Etk N-terminal domain-containing protein [Holdemania massiliensis]